MSAALAPEAARRPRIRHGFLAAALLLVAGLHALSGDWVWVAVLGLGGVAELGVVLRARSRQAPHDADVGASPPTPGAQVLHRSELAHRQSLRMWGWLVGLTMVGGLALIMTSPSLAAVLGIAALAALVMARRERRSVLRLRALLDRADRPRRAP